MCQIFHLLLPFLKAKAKHVYLAKLKAKLYHAKDSDGPAAQTPVCMSAQGSTTLMQVDGGGLQERRQKVEHCQQLGSAQRPSVSPARFRTRRRHRLLPHAEVSPGRHYNFDCSHSV